MLFNQINRPVVRNTLKGFPGCEQGRRQDASPARDRLAKRAAELKAVRDALCDERTIEEQTIDTVVERIQKELTW